MDVLDSATLQRLQTLELPQDISEETKASIFSPDSHVLTCCGHIRGGALGLELSLVSWDLQTGGVISVIRWQSRLRVLYGTSITYSEDGKMVGVYTYSDDQDISIWDVASGVFMHSHSLKGTPLVPDAIWTHGESLRFATANGTAITIWEVTLASDITPTQIETLPTPDGLDGGRWTVGGFLPVLCRLALCLLGKGRILVWDARDSRYLLERTDINPTTISFSSDGRFLACATWGPDVYLWKDSPDGYLLHGILASGTKYPRPLFAQSGESIFAFGGCIIQLWNANSITATPSSTLTQTPTEDLILEFSPDGMLAAVAMPRDNTAMVLNLESGVPRLTINAGMEVCGLGVIGNTVVVISRRKVIAWNLPVEDGDPDARVGPEDRAWAVDLCDETRSYLLVRASMSPDSRYIALIDMLYLYVHRTSTGELLGEPVRSMGMPRFSPDGHHIWCLNMSGGQQVYRVGDGQEGPLECLENEVDVEDPLQGSPWGSSPGYQVTDDWWILSPGGKRLLMLPPPWRSYANHRLWKGRFLALLHAGLSEPVILELDVNRDL